jgi:ParB family transcriptional regulator, chromosome partitioning protein
MAELKSNLKPFDMVDNLFTSEEERQQKTERDKQSSGTPTSVPLSELKPFSKHPFKRYNSEKLQSLADSIKENGVIVPILVRPIKSGRYKYEIIAGHNRVQSSRLAGIDEIPCNIREFTNEQATIMMVDSNLQQRENILPSEKAFAYKYKLEAIKRQGKRTDLTSRQLVGKLEMADVVGQENNESGRQIQRYIRLTNLITPLLDKVDEKKMSFIPAVEISYLSEEAQGHLFDILNREENFNIPLKQASKLKGISQSGDLTYEKIDKVITDKVSSTPPTFKVPYKKVQNYFPKTITPKEFEETVIKALEAWFNAEQKDNMKNEPIENLER